MIVNKTDNEDLEGRIRKGVVKLLQKDKTFGYFLMSVPIIIKNEDAPSIFTNGQYIVVPNTKKVRSLVNRHDVKDILRHEALHMIWRHATRKKALSRRQKRIALFAEEILVNEHLGISYDGMITYHSAQEQLGIDFDVSREEMKRMTVGQIIEYIASKLPEDDSGNSGSGQCCPGHQQSDQDQQGSGDTDTEDGDDQGGFTEDYTSHVDEDYSDDKGDDIIEKEMEQMGHDNPEDFTEEAIKQAVMKNKGEEKSAGAGTSGMWSMLEDLYFEPRANWKTLLRRQLKNFKEEQAEDGRKVVHRRFHNLRRQIPNTPLMFQHKKEVFDGVYIAVDTSGSISDEEYKNQVADVLDMVRNHGVEGKILMFTDGVQREIEINSGNQDTVEKELEERTSGGTNLVPIYNQAKEEDANLLIVLSDLETYDWPDEDDFFDFDTIMVTENSRYPDEADEWGTVIEVNN